MNHNPYDIFYISANLAVSYMEKWLKIKEIHAG